MALTVDVTRFHRMGSFFVAEVEVDLDSSYATGGYSLAASDIGLSDIRFVPPAISSGYLFEYDYTNSKIKVLSAMPQHAHTQQITTGSTAAADATSGALVEDSGAAETAVRAMGTAIDTTYDIGNTQNVSAAVASEVAASTDLSSITDVKLIVFGL